MSIDLFAKFRIAPVRNAEGLRGPMPSKKLIASVFKKSFTFAFLESITDSFMLAGLLLEHGTADKVKRTVAVQPVLPDFKDARAVVQFKDARPSHVYVKFTVPLADNDLINDAVGSGFTYAPKGKNYKYAKGRCNLKTLTRVIQEAMSHSIYAGGFTTRLGFDFNLMPVGKWHSRWHK